MALQTRLTSTEDSQQLNKLIERHNESLVLIQSEILELTRLNDLINSSFDQSILKDIGQESFPAAHQQSRDPSYEEITQSKLGLETTGELNVHNLEQGEASLYTEEDYTSARSDTEEEELAKATQELRLSNQDFLQQSLPKKTQFDEHRLQLATIDYGKLHQGRTSQLIKQLASKSDELMQGPLELRVDGAETVVTDRLFDYSQDINLKGNKFISDLNSVIDNFS